MSESAKTIGGYSLGVKVRTGPHLAVFESHDKLGRVVEVACYRAASLRGRTGKDAFLEEARRTASLNHENLCLMVDAGEAGGVWYAVSVAPDAPSLRELLARGGALAPERIRVVAEGALTGLSYLRREDLRHGDLRPETVFLSAGRVLLAPRPLVPIAPRERDFHYLAPEELRAQGSDVRADLYSLGLVLVEGLTGRPVVTGETPDPALVPRIPPFPTETPPELVTLLPALLAADPADRPADPATALRILRGESVAPAGAASAAAAPAPASTPSPAAVAAAAFSPPPAEPGRLILPAGDQEAVWELGEDPTWLRLSPEGGIRVGTDESAGALARISRGAEGDVIEVPDTVTERPRVNGSLFDRHALAAGDRLRFGSTEVRYESSLTEVRRGPPTPRRRHGSPALILSSVVLCLGVLAYGAVRIMSVLGEGSDVVEAADQAEARLANQRTAMSPTPGNAAGDREQARLAYSRAEDYARNHPDDIEGTLRMWKAVEKQYPNTDSGLAAEERLTELSARRQEYFAKKWDEAAKEAGSRIEEDRLYDAFLIYHNFEHDHSDTLFTDRAGREAANLLEAIKMRYTDDMDRVSSAVDTRDYGVALDLLAAIERYGTPKERDQAVQQEEQLKAKIQETQESGENPPPEAGGPESSPPAVKPPVVSPPDGRNPPPPAASAADEAKASRHLEAARKAAEQAKWEKVKKELDALAALGATRLAADHADEIGRLTGRARVELLSYGALFHGQVKLIRGREIEITYPFASQEEMKDWVYLNPFAGGRTGNFFLTPEGVRGRGVGALVHNAVFEPASLTMQARVKPIDDTHDFGFQFFEPEELVRFYLFAVQNRFFTIGTERKPVLENTIWIFGNGAWRDNPNGELGFVRKTGSPDPNPKPGEWTSLSASKNGDQVTMTVAGKKLTGSALGDDRYQYPALQPALYVLGSEAVWDEVVIHGTLDEKWATDQMSRLRKSLLK